MALEVEGVVDGGVDAKKPLRGAGRFEALHFPLPPSRDLVRVLGAIVHPQPLLMTAGQAKGLERGGIGAQLVGDRQLGRKAPLLEQFAHQPHGGSLIPARLDQQIEDFALLIADGPVIGHARIDVLDRGGEETEGTACRPIAGIGDDRRYDQRTAERRDRRLDHRRQVAPIAAHRDTLEVDSNPRIGPSPRIALV